jgi:hypothetical protein
MSLGGRHRRRGSRWDAAIALQPVRKPVWRGDSGGLGGHLERLDAGAQVLDSRAGLPHDLGELGQGGLWTGVLHLVVVAWHSGYQVGRVPSPIGDLSQGVRVRRRRRWWTTAAVVRSDRREKERGRAGGGEKGGGARV